MAVGSESRILGAFGLQVPATRSMKGHSYLLPHLLRVSGP